MKFLRTCFVTVFVLLVAVTSAQADLYQWVDEQGVTHVTSTPPKNPKARKNARVLKESPKQTRQNGGQPGGQGRPTTQQRGRQRSGHAGKLDRLLHKIDNDRKQQAKRQAKQQGQTLDKSVLRRAKVELYVTSWCPHCQDAKRYLSSLGVPYSVYDVEEDASAKARRDKLRPGGGVPVAVINGKVISGFSEGSYKAAIASP